MSNTGIYEEDFDDDAEHDSLYADSPADGYFAGRDHPQETFVENSSVQAESEAKAREAAESRASTSEAAAPSQTSPRSSVRSPVFADESTPLLDAGPPPPDYAAATAHRPPTSAPVNTSHASVSQTDPAAPPVDSPTDHDGSNRPRSNHSSLGPRADRNPSVNYGSINRPPSNNPAADQQMGHEWPYGSRNNPFGANFPFGNNNNPFGPNFPFGPGGGPFAVGRQPEHMTDTDRRENAQDEENGQSKRKRRKMGERSRWTVRSCCRPMVLLNIVLGAMVISLVVLIAKIPRTASEMKPLDPGNGDGKTPDHDARPPNATDPSQPGISHPRNDMCPLKWFTDTISFDFTNSNSFSLTELMDPQVYMTGGISGNIWIVAAPPEQETDIRVWVSYASTEVLKVTDMDYGYTSEGLKLGFPKLETPGRPAVRKPCMDVAVGVSLKAHVELANLNLTTTNLNIQSGQGAAGYSDYFSVSETWAIDQAVFKTGHGNVNMAFWNTRDTIIESHSGTVSGIFGLQDLLSVTTWSGGIAIKVRPTEASPTKPLPATFSARSRSGSVHVGYYDRDVPDRDYQTLVETRSGSISGTYIFGSEGTFTSRSGSITAHLLPYFGRYDSPSLHTEAGSSSMNIYLLAPVNESVYTIDRLKSSHKSGSGSMNLVYPQEWEGTVEGSSKSGSISLQGKDLKVYYNGSPGSVGKHVVAAKGHGASRLEFTSGSGSVGFQVGDT